MFVWVSSMHLEADFDEIEPRKDVWEEPRH